MSLTLEEALLRTQAKEVHVHYDKVVEAIGPEKAKSLCVSLTAASQKRNKERSLVASMQAQGSVSTANLGTFNRAKLLSEIKGRKSRKLTKE